MVARRLALLLAALMLMSALAAQLAPERERATTTRPTVTASPATGRDADLIERTISADATASEIIEARVGDTVHLEVESSAPVSVELEQLDDIEVASPEGPARFELFADRPGTFAIVVVESRREIGRLEIAAG